MAMKVALSNAADTAGAVLSLLNPEGVDLIITALTLDVTTAATGACTLDAGVGSGATTKYDNIIDGVDVNAAAICADNVKNAGTNGTSHIRWESDNYLTVSTATGAVAGLVGNAYVSYIEA